MGEPLGPREAERGAGTLPHWEPAVAEALERTQGRVVLIGRATPVNLDTELARLEACFLRGEASKPRFVYEPAPASDWPRDLQRLADSVDGEPHPLAPLYAARARELALEAMLSENAGRPRFFALARARYTSPSTYAKEADARALTWLEEPDSDTARDIRSDDETCPRSLVRRMGEAVGAQRLAVRVLTSPRMSALAATGNGVIMVAAGRMVSEEDVARTVLHEVLGHAAPREASLSRRLGLFRVGTAHGSDDQEGRALVLEERHGYLRGSRKLELGRRHVACRAVENGADFVDTVALLRAHRTPIVTALRIAARAHRGGGLGREAVYLPSYLRVRAAYESKPELDAVLACGRVAVDVAPTLAGWLHLARDS